MYQGIKLVICISELGYIVCIIVWASQSISWIVKYFSFYLCVCPCNVDVMGQFQKNYEFVHDLINNVLHNLVWDQQNATHSNEITMLISYVSYWHALKTFKVESFNWEMEVVLMHTETLHTIIFQWEKKWSTDWGGILGLESKANVFI
jgi:hypothetical protein